MGRETPASHEKRLVRRAQTGDAAAFAKLFEAHKRDLWRTAKTVLENETTAADALQETALRAWRSLPQFSYRSSFGTWLMRILLNVSFDLRKREQRAAPAEPHEYDEPLWPPRTSSHDDVDRALDVQAVLKRLPASDRLVLTLFYAQDCTVKQLAFMLDVPEGTVRTRLTRARQRFKDLYETACNEKGASR